MADLLIHSMAELEDLLLPALSIAGVRDVVEVGVEGGTMTERLLELTAEAGGTLTCIDPKPNRRIAARIASAPHAHLADDTSLNVIPRLEADAWIVDGDHNWWTVYQESLAIWERTRATGRSFLVFYHDVGWPWARRDLYYAPDQIPREFVHPYTFDKGVTLDNPGVVAGGFEGKGGWACALREGGPRNGVLTAVEDFVLGREEGLLWAQVPAVFGLGVLFDRDAPWAEELGALLQPWHMNPIMARLERNRLENYLRVLALQEQMREAVR